MSSRAIISAKMRGKVYAIYCHHDGYPEHIIPLLRDCYNTQEKVEALIMMGNTSAIHETPEECDPYTKYGESYEKNAPTVTDEWELHNGYYHEYFWDGEQWFYVEGRMLPKPISAWEEEK
ncbi:MAG: hypothetical protein LBR10_10005 [Prevotellaceae bacterium]|jgi:hypothetical protein|nr:hypothetical protein [Prevotellaceae bacterium]